MKVLVAAVACAPVGSSEEFLGWQAVRAISRHHEVWVVTREENRTSIEEADASGALVNVHFQYVKGFERWARNATLRRLQAWLEYIHWSRNLLSVARALHERCRFDLAHHITYSAWRVPSSLWRLNIPFIWGPIGGGGDVPLRFFGSMSFPGMAFEALRKIAQFAMYLPGPRRCAREAAWVLASNAETAELLTRMRGSSEGVSSMWPTYFSKMRVARFTTAKLRRATGEPLRLFAGGTALGSKGLGLALRGLRCAANRGVPFLYTIACDGPERPHLQRLTNKLHLDSHLRIVRNYTGGEYVAQLQASDCFLLPSFRENLGLTMIEAMMAGAVPIVADISAPGEVVTSECGIKIPVTSSDEMAAAIGEAVERLFADPGRAEILAKNASSRAQEIVNSMRYEDSIQASYRSALALRRVPVKTSAVWKYSHS
jgi:glycosyltransferase involved in cell wall biosynthesis